MSNEQIYNLMAQYFSKYGLSTNDNILRKFACLTDRLLTENKKFNLTAITDVNEIIIKHYIDSLSVLNFFDIKPNATVIDIGTGAGFPGLPLLLYRDDLNITLLDSTHKKINFIGNLKSDLLLSCEPICGRAEILNKNHQYRHKYDIAVSRAVAKLNLLIELCMPFIKKDGMFIAYKSLNGQEEIRNAESVLRKMNCTIAYIKTFTIENNTRMFIAVKNK